MPSGPLKPHEVAYLAALEEKLPAPARAPAHNYATALMQRGFPVLFDQHHLAVVAGVSSQTIGQIRSNPAAYYTRFRIPKQRGGSRLIAAPTVQLRKILDWLHIHLTSRLAVHHAAHGFRRGRSIVTNATPHVGAAAVLRLDLEDFFGTVRASHCAASLRDAGYSRGVSALLAELMTLDGALPQGAPTSPDVANTAAFPLDEVLTAIARRRNLCYTRYADDLTFSGNEIDTDVLMLVGRAISRAGFRLQDRKSRILRAHQRQLVTGLVVNDQADWPRSRRRWLRQEVHMLERFGVDAHLARRGPSRSGYKEFIYGHVYALHQTRPAEARAYLARLDSVAWPY